TPHDPPSQRMEREPVLRTDHSQERETIDYYATYELPLQAQPGLSNRPNLVVGKVKKYPVDTRRGKSETITDVQGVHAFTSVPATSPQTVIHGLIPKPYSMTEGSGAIDGLRPMAGAITGKPSNGCVTVGLIVLQNTPMLELQGLYAKDFETRDRVVKMNSHEVARIISCGELEKNGILGIRCNLKTADQVTGLALMPQITEDNRVMTKDQEGKLIPTISSITTCPRCDEKKLIEMIRRMKEIEGHCDSVAKAASKIERLSKVVTSERTSEYLNGQSMTTENTPLLIGSPYPLRGKKPNKSVKSKKRGKK
ncbi:MAG TPA: hypothetical protein VK861_06240, partial [Bacteroidales bacterium]|nr:hypothetical protein [Bacteroidales bacterium]